MKNILITGGTGFIGQALVKKLLIQNNNITMIVLENELYKVPKNNKVKTIICSLDEIDKYYDILSKEKYDIIYHLAWSCVSTEYKNNYSIQFKNVDYAYKIMELSSILKCKKVIATGSVSEYSYVDQPVNGKQRPCPADIYGAAKVAVNILCDIYAKQHDISFNWVLIPSVYGPGRDDNNIITYVIKSILNKKYAKLTKLEQMWDYIYISDLADALVLIGDKGAINKTYVVGSGQSRQLKDYIYIIRDKIDPLAKIGIGELPYKTDRVDNSIVDISELINDTGYKPQISFEVGIMETIDYFKKNGDCNFV